jgi:hypothetical protein
VAVVVANHKLLLPEVPVQAVVQDLQVLTDKMLRHQAVQQEVVEAETLVTFKVLLVLRALGVADSLDLQAEQLQPEQVHRVAQVSLAAASALGLSLQAAAAAAVK